MPYELFERPQWRGRVATDQPIVRVNAEWLYFNKAAASWLLEIGSFVELRLDRENLAVAICPVSPRTGNAYKLTGSTCGLHVPGFIELAAIPEGKYDATMDKIDRRLLFSFRNK
jgi:hypothetical protein